MFTKLLEKCEQVSEPCHPETNERVRCATLFLVTVTMWRQPSAVGSAAVHPKARTHTYGDARSAVSAKATATTHTQNTHVMYSLWHRTARAHTHTPHTDLHDSLRHSYNAHATQTAPHSHTTSHRMCVCVQSGARRHRTLHTHTPTMMSTHARPHARPPAHKVAHEEHWTCTVCGSGTRQCAHTHKPGHQSPDTTQDDMYSLQHRHRQRHVQSAAHRQCDNAHTEQSMCVQLAAQRLCEHRTRHICIRQPAGNGAQQPPDT